jgi:pilus assembly protein FimV
VIVARLPALARGLAALWRPRGPGRTEPVEARGPLSDPEDVTPQTGTAAYAASLREQLTQDPDNLGTHLALCRLYHAQSDVARFVAAAEVMHEHVHDPGSMEWHEVAVMGEELAPGDPLFAAPGDAESAEPETDADEPAAQEPVAEVAAAEHEPESHVAEPVPDTESEFQASAVPPAAAEPTPEAQPEPTYVGDGGSGFSDDPVDTKLDLARAYLDMGDPDGARAMLDEVIEEGSQAQQDEAKRLLPDATD